MSQIDTEKDFYKYYCYIIKKAESLTSNVSEQEELISKGLVALAEASQKNIYTSISQKLRLDPREESLPQEYIAAINSGHSLSEDNSILEDVDELLIRKEYLEKIYDFVTCHFSPKDCFIFFSYYGIFGFPKLTPKELSEKVNNVYHYIFTVLKKIYKRMNEYDLQARLTKTEEIEPVQKKSYLDYLLFESNLPKISWPAYTNFIRNYIKNCHVNNEIEDELFHAGLEVLIKISRENYAYSDTEIKNKIIFAIEQKLENILAETPRRRRI